jgi:hypothetical protein
LLVIDATVAAHEASGLALIVQAWDSDIPVRVSGTFDDIVFTTVVAGDFNRNGSLDAADLDLLAGGIIAKDPHFDLDGDNDTDLDDRLKWVTDLKMTWLGDADLNGEFNSGDFVSVFTAGKYESGGAATWSEGDWNGDKRFDSGDFVTAFQGGGYEKGPRAAVAAVPEPCSSVLGSLVLLGLLRTTCRRRVS